MLKAMSSSPLSQRVAPETGKNYGSPSGLRARIVGLLPDAMFLPLRRMLYGYRLARNLGYDYGRLWRGSSAVNRGDTRAKLAALITMQYHGVEKGLSLKDPRPGFGLAKMGLLLSQLERYATAFGWDDNTLNALKALEAYVEFNREHPIGDVGERVSALRASAGCSADAGQGGTRVVTREEFYGRARRDLDAFFLSRSSVRQFADSSVEPELIERAVRIAQRAPCVCNRQSGRVHVLSGRQDIADALTIQGGARGFEDQVPLVLVLTSELANFQSAGERNQCWIDGGLFAMTLIWGLHSLGLVSCCLNWSKEGDDDRRLKRRFAVPDSESVLFLLAVGHPAETFRVALSTRKPLDEVIVLH